VASTSKAQIAALGVHNPPITSQIKRNPVSSTETGTSNNCFSKLHEGNAQELPELKRRTFCWGGKGDVIRNCLHLAYAGF
jgi:hypothetical protein